jgi:hypothetical protein
MLAIMLIVSPSLSASFLSRYIIPMELTKTLQDATQTINQASQNLSNSADKVVVCAQQSVTQIITCLKAFPLIAAGASLLTWGLWSLHNIVQAERTAPQDQTKKRAYKKYLPSFLVSCFGLVLALRAPSLIYA